MKDRAALCSNGSLAFISPHIQNIRTLSKSANWRQPLFLRQLFFDDFAKDVEKDFLPFLDARRDSAGHYQI